MAKPLVDKQYRLQKFSGKGGWTYAEIPEVLKDEHNPFGWVRVRGSIDDFPLEKCKLQPMGNGRLFFPVNAFIRKKIGKQAGDTVHIVLYPDEATDQIIEELKACFEFEPPAVAQAFEKLSEFDRNTMVGWVYDSKNEEEKADRIVEVIRRLSAEN